MKKITTIAVIILILAGGFFLYRQKAETAAQKAAEAWLELKSDSSIVRLKDFIAHYPDCQFASRARQRLDSLIMEADWKAAEKGDSLQGYIDFKEKHPHTPYENTVAARIAGLERAAAWKKARKKNSIAAYKEFISAYPKSRQAAAARQKIIDLEVDAIFAGEHGELPPPQKTSSGSSNKNTIEIENRTDYTLTVRYSGAISVKVVIPARGGDTVTLPAGQYRVAASVNHPNVTPFAGSHNLAGGDYSSIFYIVGL